MVKQTELVTIGKIQRPFGIKGEVRVESLTDVPGRFEGLERVTLTARTGKTLETRVTHVRAAGLAYIVGLEAFATPEEAATYRGGLLQIARSLSPVSGGDQYYECDLVGMVVRDEAGQELGRLEEIWPCPENHLFVVRREGREVLIPALKHVVLSVDMERHVMTVRPTDGLLEYQDAM